jgi:hypothetical protein
MRFKIFLVMTGLALLLGPAIGLSQFPGPGDPARGAGKGPTPGGTRNVAPVTPPGVAGPRWEYKIQTSDTLTELGQGDLAAGLNKLGDEGWELISVPAVEPGRAFGRPRGDCYFKRPKASVRHDGPLTREPAAGTTEEAQVRILMLKHAQAPELAKVLMQLLARGGYPAALVPEPRTNALIIRGSKKDIEGIEELAMRLDIPGADEAPAPPVKKP